MVKETKMANRRTFPRNSMNEKNREELKKSQWRCEHCAFRKAPIITERARERERERERDKPKCLHEILNDSITNCRTVETSSELEPVTWARLLISSG